MINTTQKIIPRTRSRSASRPTSPQSISYALLVPVGDSLVLAARVEAGRRVAGDDNALASFIEAANSVSAPLTQQTSAE